MKKDFKDLRIEKLERELKEASSTIEHYETIVECMMQDITELNKEIYSKSH